MKITTTLITLLIMAITSVPATSQSAYLDPSFGSAGTVTTPVVASDAFVTSCALQSDGKIVVAGSIVVNGQYNCFLTKYNPDGSIDNTFHGGALLTGLPAGSVNCTVTKVAIDAGQKIMLLAYGTNEIFMMRFLPDGTLDNTFGVNGTNMVDINGYDMAYDLVFQPDGKILVAGMADWANDARMFVARFHDDGTPDSTFSSDGVFSYDISADKELAYSLSLMDDGKILVGGRMYHPLTSPISTYIKSFLMRLNSDGSFDTSFNGTGYWIDNIVPDCSVLTDLLVQPDGKIIFTGTKYIPAFPIDTGDNLLVRLNSNGSTDSSFNGNGILIFDSGGESDQLQQAELLSDGRIVGTGKINDALSDFGLFVIKSNGTLDSTFDSDGIVSTDFGATEFANAICIQPDGKIIVAGNTGIDIALARYLDIITLGEQSVPELILSIYPNPVEQMLNIRSEVDLNGATITLSTVNGQVICSERLTGSSAQFQMPSLATGVYLVQLVSGEMRVVKKIIVK